MIADEATAQSSLVSVTMSMIVLMPAPGSPTISPMAPANSTSEEALERLPSLSFRRWKRKPLFSPSPLSPGGIGANVGAALLFGHAHAERQPGLFHRRLLRLVVFAGGHPRRPFAKQLWAGHQGCQRRTGHSDRAQVPAFELGRQIEAC